ncbi:hypothetical protein N431DRAFT_516942 [Stipitochalara longipes BDJ]|nr:hypothetical protein N431DRAFT_516942 [Stipitochalara longipes BDJ]
MSSSHRRVQNTRRKETKKVLDNLAATRAEVRFVRKPKRRKIATESKKLTERSLDRTDAGQEEFAVTCEYGRALFRELDIVIACYLLRHHGIIYSTSNATQPHRNPIARKAPVSACIIRSPVPPPPEQQKKKKEKNNATFISIKPKKRSPFVFLYTEMLSLISQSPCNRTARSEKEKPELENRKKIVSFDRSRESRNQFSPALPDEEAAQLTPKKFSEEEKIRNPSPDLKRSPRDKMAKKT